MGIYDRDYYRKEGPSYLGSFIERGKVCKWLIVINVACFVFQILTMRQARPEELEFVSRARDSGWFTDWFLLDVNKVLHGEIWRLLTYAFLHSEYAWTHIIFN